MLARSGTDAEATPEQSQGDQVNLRFHVHGDQPTSCEAAELWRLVRKEKQLEEGYRALYWFANQQQVGSETPYSWKGTISAAAAYYGRCLHKSKTLAFLKDIGFGTSKTRGRRNCSPSEESGDRTPEADEADGTVAFVNGELEGWVDDPDPQYPGLEILAAVPPTSQPTPEIGDLIDCRLVLGRHQGRGVSRLSLRERANICGLAVGGSWGTGKFGGCVQLGAQGTHHTGDQR
ncbi:Hypothetical predicted protein [Pelobates cultripes]|uniref:Uncharacterized protein n=1 Tax=Pelobates cultripes TaxID=61616 RepID=A0AAD1R3A0_PELCU|nr:Hypothetical predicted protein [Pelobates cultripes]